MFQKELFDAIESELAGSSDNLPCIFISNDITYLRDNVRKTAQQIDPEGAEPNIGDFTAEGTCLQDLPFYDI